MANKKRSVPFNAELVESITKQKGIYKKDIASHLCVTHQHYNRYLRSGLIPRDTMVDLSEYLDIDINLLKTT